MLNLIEINSSLKKDHCYKNGIFEIARFFHSDLLVNNRIIL